MPLPPEMYNLGEPKPPAGAFLFLWQVAFCLFAYAMVIGVIVIALKLIGA